MVKQENLCELISPCSIGCNALDLLRKHLKTKIIGSDFMHQIYRFEFFEGY